MIARDCHARGESEPALSPGRLLLQSPGGAAWPADSARKPDCGNDRLGGLGCMDDRARFPPARGDEADLFREYNDELLRTVAQAVGYSTPQLIEDACSFAWAKFLQCQPDRDGNWKGWLFRTAQREGWRLDARSRESRSLSGDVFDEDRLLEASTRGRPDPFEIQLDVNEAFEILEHVPERLRRIALLRALGMRHKDIS